MMLCFTCYSRTVKTKGLTDGNGRYRSIEYKPSTRRSRPGESDVAVILRGASIDQLDRFNQFLLPQGFKLIEFDDSTRGVSTAGRVWILARGVEADPPEFYTTDRVISEIRIREGERREDVAIWFLHIWMIYLSLIYTRPGRGVSEVSGYIDATFSREALTHAVEEHIENIRQMGISEGAESKVVTILDAEQGQDIPRRVLAFLTLMSGSGFVYEASKDEYQQTLLGAYEIAESYNHTLRVPVENILKNVVNIAAPSVTQVEEKETEINGAN